MIYAFDLDGTLCRTPDKNGEYEKAFPITERINVVNKLYDQGHIIKIYTARGMTRFQDDGKRCYEEYFILTREQLERWGVKYHKLILGKQAYDRIIDDKAINDKEFFNETIS